MPVENNSSYRVDSTMLCIPVNVNALEIDVENVPLFPQNIDFLLAEQMHHELVHSGSSGEVDGNNERNGEESDNEHDHGNDNDVDQENHNDENYFFVILFAICLFYIYEIIIS